MAALRTNLRSRILSAASVFAAGSLSALVPTSAWTQITTEYAEMQRALGLARGDTSLVRQAEMIIAGNKEKEQATGETLFRHAIEIQASLSGLNLTSTSAQPPGSPNASGSGTNTNADGTCIVGYQDSGFFTPYHALLWTRTAGPFDLGTLDPPNNSTRSSFATDVNGDCTVVTGVSDTAGGITQHAFRWTQAGGMVDLGAPAGANRNSRAFGVSAVGDVIVGDAEFVDANAFSGFRNGAFRWSGGTFQNLGAFEPGFFSVANAVSADGTVVVGEGGVSVQIGNTSTNGSRAFRWTQAQGLQPIGPLPGERFAAAISVSDNGKVIIGISATGRDNQGYRFGSKPWRWTEATGIQDLRQLLIDAGLDMTGITLVSVTGISPDGQWIIGEATSSRTAANETATFIVHYCDSAIGGACSKTGFVRADFGGDLRSDILWRNVATGDNAVWQIDGTAVSASQLIAAVGDASWRIHGSGDFNANGKADILWRNVATGDNAIWLMDGFNVVTPALIAAVPDAAWTIAGAGDFDGNGKTDLLWRNGTTGDNAIWLMDGTAVSSALFIARVADVNWTIERLGDFDNDGKADILWRNTGTGDVAIWLMNGGTLKASAFLGAVPTAWAIAGVADYDGNGKSDILWRNASTGENAIWFIDGLAVVTTGFIPGVPDPAWAIVATGDYNADGRADILWRNTATGQNAIWLINGLSLIGSSLLPAVPDANWRIVAQ